MLGGAGEEEHWGKAIQNVENVALKPIVKNVALKPIEKNVALKLMVVHASKDTSVLVRSGRKLVCIICAQVIRDAPMMPQPDA